MGPGALAGPTTCQEKGCPGGPGLGHRPGATPATEQLQSKQPPCEVACCPADGVGVRQKIVVRYRKKTVAGGTKNHCRPNQTHSWSLGFFLSIPDFFCAGFLENKYNRTACFLSFTFIVFFVDSLESAGKRKKEGKSH